jgi:gamma-glutamyltranspeptidase/glutathione hydrolase
VRKVAPIERRYRDVVVLLPPPCSTGGVLTAFTLALLAHFPIGQADHGSAEHLRLLYETLAATTRARPFWEKANQEREADDAVAFLLDEAFVAPFVAEIRAALADAAPSTPTVEPPGPSNTSHLSVIDANGMAVSLTTTAGETAGYVLPGTGFIPNNILGEEDLNPGGFHLWRPGQRIPTMMTPMIVLRDGQIRLVSGSGGSNRIRSAILQTLVNVLDYDLPLADAVNRARIHVEERILQCEHGFDPQAVATLERQGYPVNRWSVRSIYFGGAHSVARVSDGTLVAAGDDRRGGTTGFI